jgi:hypothetical protein
MKKLFLIFLSIITFVDNGKAQTNKSGAVKEEKIYPIKGTTVTVSNWENIDTLFSDDFFERNKKTIIDAIGTNEFEQVKKYSRSFNWPTKLKEVIILPEVNWATTFDKLFIYKISDINDVTEEDINFYSILRVPLAENDSILTKKNNEQNIYFIIETKYVDITWGF